MTVSFINNVFKCDCKNSSYCDPYHKHIDTGNLCFTSTCKLQKLSSKGPDYWGNKTIVKNTENL